MAASERQARWRREQAHSGCEVRKLDGHWLAGWLKDSADLLMGFAKNGSANTFTVGGDGHGDTYANELRGTFNGSAIQSFFPTTATNTYKSIMTTDA